MAERNIIDTDNLSEEETIYYSRDDDYRDDQQAKMPSPLKLWLKLWFVPSEAWNAMLHAAIFPQRLAQAVFYPISALAAASEFANLFYNGYSPAEIGPMLQKAVIIYVAFFMSYFAFPYLAALFMKKNTAQRFRTDFGKCYIMSLLSSLGVIYTLYCFLPFMEAVIAFLPLYTLYISYQGLNALHLSEKSIGAWITVIALLLLLPLSIYKLFSLLMHFT